MLITLDATATNLTTTPTLNLTLGATATGAKTITNPNGGALIAGDILGLHHRLILGYESVLGVWKLLNPGLPLSQAAGDLRYAPIAYTQYGGSLTVNNTLSAADSGKWFFLISGITNLPAPADGLRYRLTGLTAATGTVAAGAGVFLYLPDGTSALAGSVALSHMTTCEFISGGGSWIVSEMSGKVIIQNATAANQAVAFGQVIGLGQSWSDVTASRALGSTYTNSTGKPIQVIVTVAHNSVSTATVSVGGVTIASSYNDGARSGRFSFIVPNGVSYIVPAVTGVALSLWTELR